MTAKERQRIARLESENAQLRAEIAKHLRIYGDTLMELVEARATIEAVRAAMGDQE